MFVKDLSMPFEKMNAFAYIRNELTISWTYILLYKILIYIYIYTLYVYILCMITYNVHASMHVPEIIHASICCLFAFYSCFLTLPSRLFPLLFKWHVRVFFFIHCHFVYLVLSRAIHFGRSTRKQKEKTRRKIWSDDRDSDSLKRYGSQALHVITFEYYWYASCICIDGFAMGLQNKIFK